jgi:hypothetical protein
MCDLLAGIAYLNFVKSDCVSVTVMVSALCNQVTACEKAFSYFKRNYIYGRSWCRKFSALSK